MTEKEAEFEVPPPGVGEKTVTVRVPVVVMRELDTVAVSWLAETKVVGSEEPFHRTTEPET